MAIVFVGSFLNGRGGLGFFNIKFKIVTNEITVVIMAFT